MVYVPNYDITNCAYVRDSNTIRVYDSIPIQGRTIDYTDYYYNSHYMHISGTTTFSNYTTFPTCISDDDITTNFYYRNDISDIVFLFIAFIGINYILISKLVKLFFRGSKVL